MIIGETLKQRIGGGPMPIDIVVQVTRGAAAARTIANLLTAPPAAPGGEERQAGPDERQGEPRRRKRER